MSVEIIPQRVRWRLVEGEVYRTYRSEAGSVVCIDGDWYAVPHFRPDWAPVWGPYRSASVGQQMYARVSRRYLETAR